MSRCIQYFVQSIYKAQTITNAMDPNTDWASRYNRGLPIAITARPKTMNWTIWRKIPIVAMNATSIHSVRMVARASWEPWFSMGRIRSRGVAMSTIGISARIGIVTPSTRFASTPYTPADGHMKSRIH